ncbi:conserved hypothetical protein, partial [Ricinus communis]
WGLAVAMVVVLGVNFPVGDLLISDNGDDDYIDEALMMVVSGGDNGCIDRGQR